MTGATRYLGRHRTIHCIGDSNVLVFDEMVFTRDAEADIFACRSSYLPRMSARDLTDRGGSLCGPLRASLITQSLCIDQDGPPAATHLSRERHWQNVETARERRFAEPILLFHFGDLDLRFTAIPRLAAAGDFVFPNAPAGSILATVDTTREIVPYSIVREMTLDAFEPYMDALVLLKAAGFRHLFAHTLAPQIEDDEAYAKVYGYAPLALRYKLLHAFNDALRAAAEQRAVPVIDTWAETTTPMGLLNPAYDLDGSHLNTAAARVSIGKLIRVVVPARES